jgi:hypothetical protein
MQVTDRLPDPAHTDVGIALSSEWKLGTPERQKSAADAIVDAWQRNPWPDGLLSYAIYLDTDGDLIRHYSQWTSEAASDEFSRSGRQPRIDLIDAAVPGIERRDYAKYRLYRGNRADDGRIPGAIVAVRVDTDGQDLAETWVDAVFEALEQDKNLPEGGIGAFFHISTDGEHVLNYAEWISAEAHKQALAATGGAFPKVRCGAGCKPCHGYAR